MRPSAMHHADRHAEQVTWSLVKSDAWTSCGFAPQTGVGSIAF